MFMDNDIAGIPQALQKSGHPVKAIHARLKGKEGRPRGNLMGKRNDFLAMTLTYPERGESRPLVPFFIPLTNIVLVTPYNIAYLQELVRRGPNAYPGARHVVRDTGNRIDLRRNKQADVFFAILQVSYFRSIQLPAIFT